MGRRIVNTFDQKELPLKALERSLGGQERIIPSPVMAILPGEKPGDPFLITQGQPTVLPAIDMIENRNRESAYFNNLLTGLARKRATPATVIPVQISSSIAGGIAEAYNSIKDDMTSTKPYMLDTPAGTFNGDMTISKGNVIFKGQQGMTILTIT